MWGMVATVMINVAFELKYDEDSVCMCLHAIQIRESIWLISINPTSKTLKKKFYRSLPEIGQSDRARPTNSN